MGELVLHVPMNVGGHEGDFSLCRQVPRQWLLQPVPHGIRIAGLALCGRHSATRPAAAMPKDLFLMPMSQLQTSSACFRGTLRAHTFLPCRG